MKTSIEAAEKVAETDLDIIVVPSILLKIQQVRALQYLRQITTAMSNAYLLAVHCCTPCSSAPTSSTVLAVLRRDLAAIVSLYEYKGSTPVRDVKCTAKCSSIAMVMRAIGG